MFCQKCGEKNEGDAHFCGSCGESLDNNAHSSSRKWLLFGIFACLVVLIGIAYEFMQTTPENEIHIVEENHLPKQIELASEEQKEPIIEEPKEHSKPVATSPSEKDKTTVIKEAMPKVFTIFTQEALGSGFLYKKGGFIITNAHVVAGYTDVVVRNSDGKDTPGKVIGISDRYDIALILANDYVNTEPLPIELNESDVGSEVIAIGSPQGFENTASVGYLTGIGRDLEYGFIYENVYQIDALIDQGSSGGPLLDVKSGKVIGINSLLYTGSSSFGFSIPMYSMVKLVDAWAKDPMNADQVASLFDVYEDYVYYDDDVENEADSYYREFMEEYVEEQEVNNGDADYIYDESTLENFLLAFRNHYEYALYEEDFYWIEDMLLPGSTAYNEFKKYIADISGQGMLFSFTNNTVTHIDLTGESAIVTTFEQFDFLSADGELTTYERTKDYSIVIDEFGNYQITDIYIRN